MFAYTTSLQMLLQEIIKREPEVFGHVRLELVGVGMTLTRNARAAGTIAKVVPLRFEHGARQGERNGHLYLLPTVVFMGRELLYLAVFYLPRFQDLSLEEKIRTICHELYHISPLCNGDVRRFPGDNYAHGRSRKWYDTLFEDSVQRILKWLPEAQEYDWLTLTFRELSASMGPLQGYRFSMPRLIPLEGPGSAQMVTIKLGGSGKRPAKKR